jgi:hypothetical protein
MPDRARGYQTALQACPYNIWLITSSICNTISLLQIRMTLNPNLYPLIRPIGHLLPEGEGMPDKASEVNRYNICVYLPHKTNNAIRPFTAESFKAF